MSTVSQVAIAPPTEGQTRSRPTWGLDMLPTQFGGRAGGRAAEQHRRLMGAVLLAAVDDCRGGSAYRHSAGYAAIDTAHVRHAIAWVASTDRAWPFSFENLCDALGLDAEGLRQALRVVRSPA